MLRRTVMPFFKKITYFLFALIIAIILHAHSKKQLVNIYEDQKLKSR